VLVEKEQGVIPSEASEARDLGEDSQEDQEGQEGRMPDHGFDLPTVRRDAEHLDAATSPRNTSATTAPS
jgi:hypothetical protein